MPDTTCHMSISLDGFVAGPDQSREAPMGTGDPHRNHAWHLGDPRANEADETAAVARKPFHRRVAGAVVTASAGLTSLIIPVSTSAVIAAPRRDRPRCCGRSRESRGSVE